MMTEEPVNPRRKNGSKLWKILRPLSKLLNPTNLQSLINNHVTLFSLVDDWCHLLEPGDRIEVADDQDLIPWIYGELIYSKKVRLRDVSAWSLEHALIRHMYEWDYDRVPTLDFIMPVLSQVYNEPVYPGTVIVIRCILVDRVEVPNYVLKFE